MNYFEEIVPSTGGHNHFSFLVGYQVMIFLLVFQFHMKQENFRIYFFEVKRMVTNYFCIFGNKVKIKISGWATQLKKLSEVDYLSSFCVQVENLKKVMSFQ